MNKWKLGFFSLLTINMLILFTLIFFVFIPAKESELNKEKSSNTSETFQFDVSSTKGQLNELINRYLKEEASGSGLKYTVYLDDKVYLNGGIKAFNNIVDTMLTFQPEVKSNGDIRLYVDELTIGRLELPVRFVLKYINDHYNLPHFVHINDNQEYLDIDLDELQLRSNLSVKAKSFDLENDHIEFSVYYPLDNLRAAR